MSRKVRRLTTINTPTEPILQSNTELPITPIAKPVDPLAPGPVISTNKTSMTIIKTSAPVIKKIEKPVVDKLEPVTEPIFVIVD